MGFLSLIVRLGADTTGFSKGVKQMGVEADGAGTKISNAIGRYLKAATALAAIKKSIDFASEIKDTADRLEIGTDFVQQLGEAARRSGQDIGVAAGGLEKLGKNLEEGFSDSKKVKALADNLSAFGMSLDDVRSKTPEEVFKAMLAQMAEGGTSAGKLSAGLDLIGKNYGKLIPMAKEMDAVKGMGILDPQQIDDLDRFGDTLTGLWTKLNVTIGKGIAGWQMVLPGGVDREAGRLTARADMEDAKRLAAGIATAKREQAILDEQANAKAKTHMEVMDRVVQLEREAAEIGEQARRKALTEEQRRNELLERRAKIMDHLNSQPDEVGAFMMEANARFKKELAQIDLELAADKRTGGGIQQAEGLARQGIFLGGKHDPLVDINQKQLSELRAISKAVKKLSMPRDVNSYF